MSEQQDPASPGQTGATAIAAADSSAAASAATDAAILSTGALQNAIIQSANFSSIATDSRGVIQIFNIGAQRMLGYSAADVVNRMTPADLSDPGELLERAEFLSAELGIAIAAGFEALVFKASRGIEDIYELTYVRKDGSRFPALVSVTALRDPSGSTIGYLLIGTDNTARKHAEADRVTLERRLRDQQFYTRFLTEASTEALLTTDPLGTISATNVPMENLLQFSRNELVGTAFRSFFADPGQADACLEMAIGGGKVSDWELVAKPQAPNADACSTDAPNADAPSADAPSAAGSAALWSAHPFYGAGGELQGVFAAAHDVSELRRLERRLEEVEGELVHAGESAKAATVAVSDFLSGVANKLRSPLNTILGFAQLIDTDIPPPTLAQAASVEQILRAGWHLLELINEIVARADLESDALVLLEPTSLTEILRECHAAILPRARTNGVGVAFPPAGLPCFVLADRTRLKHVVMSLLSNAIAYNKVNGQVVVAIGLTSVAGKPDRVRLSVGDTGMGLAPAMLARIFHPFNTEGRVGGAANIGGIGLAASHRMVELMGGALHAESTLGAGSVFWFELDAAAEPQTPPSVAPLPTVPRGAHRRKLLYVEDNSSNLELVEQLLARVPDIRLITARDGRHGVLLARSEQPDVILMDIHLPGISGIEALQLLRSDLATARIPVIAVSGDAMPRDIQKGMKAGFFRYLTKPFDVRQFMETVEAGLELAGQKAGLK